MPIEGIKAELKELDKMLHKHGNKIDIHVKQIYLVEKRVELLDKHRQGHELELAAIRGQQDHSSQSMEKLSQAIDNLTGKITTLFTIKNMALGVMATLSFITVASGFLIKTYLDYFK